MQETEGAALSMHQETSTEWKFEHEWGQVDQWAEITVNSEERTSQERMNFQPTARSSITQICFWKESEQFFASIDKCRSNRTKRARARHLETRHKKATLAAGWTKVLRRSLTEKVVPAGRTQAVHYSRNKTSSFGE
ncbi:unnamed protein product [Cercopithifilaria johnstoni]|uniref:Uncharacterized protein n=1 Tax=Cercopithifilaria johnstoni TaxID=2874296 RepID=A0A8J2M162_9BILA|nr:unnamed protein product [Cercopithifilaria johnstoni]